MANSLPLGVVSTIAESRYFLASMPTTLGWRGLFIAFARLWLFLIFFVVSTVVLAETIPATVTYAEDSIDGLFHPQVAVNGVLTDFAEPAEAALATTNSCIFSSKSVRSCWINGYGYWSCWLDFYHTGCNGDTPGWRSAEIYVSKVPNCYLPYTPQNGQCVKPVYSCPSNGGWTLSSDQQSCTRPDCPAGYERDPNTGTCLEPCPADQVRNPSTMQCEVQCTSPLVRTASNTCDCPDPLTLIDGNTCIGRDDKDRGESCGQEQPDWWQ